MATTKARTTKPKKPNLDVYQAVTDRIVAALEAGVVPWRRPWRNAYADTRHRNLASKKTYRGINPFLLDVTALTMGYEAPYWVTFKQARDLAYKQWLRDESKKDTEEERKLFDTTVFDRGVRKGEKSSLVVFWKPIKVTERDPVSGNETEKMIPLLKHFNVFNVEQCDGVPYPAPDRTDDFEPDTEAQRVIDDMPDAPPIKHSGNRAFYSPMMDQVTLPKPEAFDTPGHYYSTAYHELVHSTGHESRLHRIKSWASFGTEPYGKEELVAQMGAAMLCGVVGLDVSIQTDAAYIANWLQALNDDKKLVAVAAAQAQRASDFILGTSFEEAS